MKSKGSDDLPLKRRRTVRSFRKERHHLTNCGAKPRLMKIFISLSWLMLSKNPCMSNSSIPVRKPALCAACMSWSSVRPASRVDEAFRPPNCVVGTRACLVMSL